MLSDCFLSVVSKDCARDEVMIRARRKGDIEKIFPNAKVSRYTKSDYLYRAAVKREYLKAALCGEVDRINYDNFKSSVTDTPLHNAYLRVWTAMSTLQEVRPYSDGNPALDFDQDDLGLLGEGKAAKGWRSTSQVSKKRRGKKT
jgi:hypothetical protein